MNAEEEGIGQFEEHQDYTFFPLDNQNKPIEMLESHKINQIGEIEFELQKTTFEIVENTIIAKDDISEAIVGSRNGNEITQKKSEKVYIYIYIYKYIYRKKWVE